jgi:hypothetical protein
MAFVRPFPVDPSGPSRIAGAATSRPASNPVWSIYSAHLQILSPAEVADFRVGRSGFLTRSTNSGTPHAERPNYIRRGRRRW